MNISLVITSDQTYPLLPLPMLRGKKLLYGIKISVLHFLLSRSICSNYSSKIPDVRKNCTREISDLGHTQVLHQQTQVLAGSFDRGFGWPKVKRFAKIGTGKRQYILLLAPTKDGKHALHDEKNNADHPSMFRFKVGYFKRAWLITSHKAMPFLWVKKILAYVAKISALDLSIFAAVGDETFLKWCHPRHCCSYHKQERAS